MLYDRTVLDAAYQNAFNGYSPFVFEGKVLLAKHISPVELFKANAHILLFQSQLKEAGIPYEYNLIQEAIAKGFWTNEQDQEIAALEKKIQLKEEILPKMPIPSQIKQVQNEIKYLNKQLQEKENERFKLTSNSFENKVALEKRDYIGFLCIYKDIGVPFWKTYEDFANSNTDLVNKLISLYFTTVHEMSSSIIRALARTTDARFRIKSHQTANVETLSVIFLELKQWCEFYKNISELPDCPDENILKDDEKLDAWLMTRKAKNQSEKSVNNGDGVGFTGIVGATKEDMEILQGTDAKTALQVGKTQNG